MPDIPKEYNMEIWHTGGYAPCGKIAFYYKGPAITGEIIESANSIRLDGTYPVPGDVIICGSCGGSLLHGCERKGRA